MEEQGNLFREISEPGMSAHAAPFGDALLAVQASGGRG